MQVVEVIVLWGAAATGAFFLAAFIAGAKNRDWSAWASWSFLFPPAVLILLLMPTFRGLRQRKPSLDELDALES
jgi:hypothetical protein